MNRTTEVKGKWTGGEWEIRGWEGLDVHDEDGHKVCRATSMQHAQFIAAAPKQNKALTMVGDKIDNLTIRAAVLGRVGLYFTLEQLQQIQAALSAALGEE